MSRTRSLTMTTLGAVALILGLAACGGSSSDGGSATTTKAPSSQSGGSATGSDGDTSTTGAEGDTPTTVVADGGGKFCEDLASFINDNAMADVDVTDPEAYREAVEESTDQSNDLLSEAPSELDGAVEALVDAQTTVIAALEKVDFDYSKLPPEALSVMSSPKLEAAQKELQAYVEDTCGIEIPDPPVATAETVPTPTQPS